MQSELSRIRERGRKTTKTKQKREKDRKPLEQRNKNGTNHNNTFADILKCASTTAKKSTNGNCS